MTRNGWSPSWTGWCGYLGLTNIWVPPIRNRIDMLATGIESPVGVKVAGPDLAEIDRIAARWHRTRGVPGVTSAVAERLGGDRP